MESRLRFESRDIASVEETWRRFVPSASLLRVDPHRFRFDWFSAEMPGVSLVSYELAAQVQSVVEPEDQFLVCRVAAEEAWAGTARGDLDVARPWLTDGPQVRARWEHAARVNALIFDRPTAEGLARQMSGDDGLRLRVRDAAPDERTNGAHWETAFDHLQASVERLSDVDDLILAGLARQALWMTLATFPTTFRDAVRRPAQRRAAPTTVRRALDYIDENAHRPITVDDVAAAVHISTRGLQYAFRRELGTTPAVQLRRARLEGAHRELRAGVPDPIAIVARRWGFAHPSRFAAAYREAYGVLPATTRRRRR